MREIKLTQGQVALVDDEDYERVNQFKWYAQKHRNTFYAKRNVFIDGRHTTQRMHRFIMGNNLKKPMIDHGDGNGCNNQRYNLRPCTPSENMMNSVSRKNSFSIYKCVYWNKIAKKWMANIRTNGKSTHLGYFNNEIDAARAYDAACIRYFGEFAHPNFQ